VAQAIVWLQARCLYLSANKNIKEAVRYGVACGKAATLNEGTQLGNFADAEKLYKVMWQYEG
jgi:fructose-1-phosphate kinase PfkB-like protein